MTGNIPGPNKLVIYVLNRLYTYITSYRYLTGYIYKNFFLRLKI